MHKNGKVHPVICHEDPEGSIGIAPIFLDLGARLGWVVNATPRPLYPQERDPVPTLQEARCAGLDGCGKSRPHWDSIPVPSSP